MKNEEKNLIILLVNQEYHSNLIDLAISIGVCLIAEVMSLFFFFITESGSVIEEVFIYVTIFLLVAIFIITILDKGDKKRKKKLKKLNEIPQSTAFETVQEMKEFRDYFKG